MDDLEKGALTASRATYESLPLERLKTEAERWIAGVTSNGSLSGAAAKGVRDIVQQAFDLGKASPSTEQLPSSIARATPKYPDLGPFVSLCHERQFDIGCKHGQKDSLVRCRLCMVEVGEELMQQLSATGDVSTLWTKVTAFRGLKQNWDSYGAEPFNEETIQLAIKVALWLGDEWGVVPCADGTIQFYRGNEEEIISVAACHEATPPSTGAK